MDPYSGSVTTSFVPVGTLWNCTLCSVFLSNIRCMTCSRVRTSFDGTVGDHVSIVDRVQQEIVCFPSVSNRALPDTETPSVAGHRVHSFGVSHSTLHGSEGGSPSCFVDWCVVCRHTVWEDRSHRPFFMYPAFLFEGSRQSTCFWQSACQKKKSEYCSPRLVA